MSDFSISIRASREHIDGVLIPMARRHFPQAAPLMKAKLNRPIDLTVDWLLEPGKTVAVDLLVEEVDGEATTAAFPGNP